MKQKDILPILLLTGFLAAAPLAAQEEHSLWLDFNFCEYVADSLGNQNGIVEEDSDSYYLDDTEQGFCSDYGPDIVATINDVRFDLLGTEYCFVTSDKYGYFQIIPRDIYDMTDDESYARSGIESQPYKTYQFGYAKINKDGTLNKHLAYDRETGEWAEQEIPYRLIMNMRFQNTMFENYFLDTLFDPTPDGIVGREEQKGIDYIKEHSEDILFVPVEFAFDSHNRATISLRAVPGLTDYTDSRKAMNSIRNLPDNQNYGVLVMDKYISPNNLYKFNEGIFQKEKLEFDESGLVVNPGLNFYDELRERQE